MSLYPFVLDDGKRNLSRRPFAQNDCTVRALAIVTNVDYDLAYDTIKAAGRKSNDGFDLSGFLTKMGVFYGWKARRVKIPKRLTIKTFFAANLKGRFIIESSTHVIAVIDNQAHDLLRIAEDCPVHKVWEFRRLDTK